MRVRPAVDASIFPERACGGNVRDPLIHQALQEMKVEGQVVNVAFSVVIESVLPRQMDAYVGGAEKGIQIRVFAVRQNVVLDEAGSLIDIRIALAYGDYAPISLPVAERADQTAADISS